MKKNMDIGKMLGVGKQERLMSNLLRARANQVPANRLRTFSSGDKCQPTLQTQAGVPPRLGELVHKTEALSH